MKFSCGLSASGKRAKLFQKATEAKEWKKVFLWWPTTIKVENGRRVCMWLTYINRRYPSAQVTDLYGYDLYDSCYYGGKLYLGYAEYQEIGK